MASRTYKRLARHDGLWRVDGIGTVEARRRLGARVTVYFSGLTKEGLGQPYWKSSLNGLTLEFRVHSASLRDFTVGSIWQNGKRVAGPDESDNLFQIDINQLRLVTLEQSVNLNGHWVSTVLPDVRFYTGNNRTALALTLYAIVPILNHTSIQWLVIPASELLRFYVGVSARFLSAVLQGTLNRYVDWDKSRVEDKEVVLHVKENLTRKEAVVLAQAVGSPVAKTALLNIHQHLALIQVNNAALDVNHKRPLMIKADFPFNDTTHLRVSGKQMRLTDQNKGNQWAFFAMEIFHCAHPFNFLRLTIEGGELYQSQTSSGTTSGNVRPSHHTPLIEEDDYEIDDVPADERLVRLAVRHYTNQFGGLGNIAFEYRFTSMGHELQNSPEVALDVPVNAMTQEGGSFSKEAQGNLGLNEFQERIERVDRDLFLFLEMLQHLHSETRKRNWAIGTRKLKSALVEQEGWVTFFPEKIGKRRTWHKITEANGQTRPRQVVWAEIAKGTGEHFFYLLEMELKSGESGQCTLFLYMNDFSQLDESTFRNLLFLTAIQNRWPHKDNTWEVSRHRELAKELFCTMQIYRINHPRVSAIKREKSLDGVKPSLDPRAWCTTLLERIDEFLPSDF